MPLFLADPTIGEEIDLHERSGFEQFRAEMQVAVLLERVVGIAIVGFQLSIQALDPNGIAVGEVVAVERPKANLVLVG